MDYHEKSETNMRSPSEKKASETALQKTGKCKLFIVSQLLVWFCSYKLVWSGKIITGFFRKQKQRLMKGKHDRNEVKN